MENPEINTWQDVKRGMDSLEQTMKQHFPDRSVKGVDGVERHHDPGSYGRSGGSARRLFETRRGRIVRPMHALSFGNGTTR